MQAIIVVRKDIPNIMIVINWTDWINHPYCICLDIQEIDRQIERHLRKTRVIKLYNNKISQKQLWEEFFPIPWQAIQNIC